MAVRLSALRAGLPLPPRRFLVPISLRGWVDPRAIVSLLVGPLGYPEYPQFNKVCLEDKRWMAWCDSGARVRLAKRKSDNVRVGNHKLCWILPLDKYLNLFIWRQALQCSVCQQVAPNPPNGIRKLLPTGSVMPCCLLHVQSLKVEFNSLRSDLRV
jgi:hypothetical protein